MISRNCLINCLVGFIDSIVGDIEHVLKLGVSHNIKQHDEILDGPNLSSITSIDAGSLEKVGCRNHSFVEKLVTYQ